MVRVNKFAGLLLAVACSCCCATGIKLDELKNDKSKCDPVISQYNNMYLPIYDIMSDDACRVRFPVFHV